MSVKKRFCRLKHGKQLFLAIDKVLSVTDKVCFDSQKIFPIMKGKFDKRAFVDTALGNACPPAFPFISAKPASGCMQTVCCFPA